MGVAHQEQDAQTLLRAWRAGDRHARDRLIELLYPDLRRAAAGMLRRERGVSLSTGDLIHEAMARMLALDRIDWNDRAHFMALASTMLRRSIVDHVRARHRLKREHERVELHTGIAADPNIEVEALNAALDRLSLIDRERADIVEMRYFGGMDMADIARVLGISESTAKRRWAATRLWLLEALSS